MEMQFKPTVREPSTAIRMAQIKNGDNTSAGGNVKSLSSRICRWRECETPQPPLQTVWQIIYNLNVQLPYDGATPPGDICLRATKTDVYIKARS